MDSLRECLRQNRMIRTLVYFLRSIKEKFSYSQGSNNVVDNHGIKVGSKIQIIGNDNQVIIAHGAVLKKTKLIIIGNNNRIFIKDGAFLDGAVIHVEDNNCLVQIGDNTYIGPSHIACTEDGRHIIIGKDCMLSSNVHIRTGDSHSIIDMNGKRINEACSVFISDHCWIGEGAKIMKGVRLETDTVVASGTIVTHTFPSNVIIAGNPAKVIKESVSWDSRRL